MKKAIIRKAGERDISRVAEIYEEIHTEEERGNITVGWKRGIYPTESTARAALFRDDLYVIENDGVVVGSAIINREQPPAYEMAQWSFPFDSSDVLVLHTLTVSPEYFGRGYGKSMVKFYEKLAENLGALCLRLDTNVKNTVARRMYESMGYAEKGVVPCIFNGIDGVFLVCLEKILKN